MARSELKRVTDMTVQPRRCRPILLLRQSERRARSHTPGSFLRMARLPTFAQYNITFPVPVVGRGGHVGAGVVTVAMPRMVFHAPAAPCLDIVGGGAQISTTPIGDFDRVMASEFCALKRYNDARGAGGSAEGWSSDCRSAAGNGLLQLAAVVVSNVSTADTRSWTALPERVSKPRALMRLRTGWCTCGSTVVSISATSRCRPTKHRSSM